jgi:uncharacterized protein
MTDPLRQRLAALVRDAGRAVASPIAKASDDVATALAALRAAQDRRDRHRREAERALPGELVAPGVRRIRWAEAFEGNDASDLGRFALTSRIAEPLATEEACTERNSSVAPTVIDAPPWEPPGRHHGELVFLDTETTGLAGGTGTLVFLLGLARIRPTHVEVEQWLLSSPGGEHEWLDAIAASLPPDPLLVSFNGKAFDIPLLAARHRLKRRRDPFANRTHWDLLFPLRRAFDRRWSDCRLQTAERRLLGHARVDDLPGSFAPAAFHAWLRQGDTTLLNQVIAHNRHDVVSLARLLPALVRVFERPLDFDADALAIGARLERAGRDADAERRWRETPGTAARLALALALRRRGRHAEAETELLPLAERDDPTALELLAKIREHRRGDPSGALAAARRLVELEPVEERHRRRCARLEGRLARP